MLEDWMVTLETLQKINKISREEYEIVVPVLSLVIFSSNYRAAFLSAVRPEIYSVL
jgi:hypothetical protein